MRNNKKTETFYLIAKKNIDPGTVIHGRFVLSYNIGHFETQEVLEKKCIPIYTSSDYAVLTSVAFHPLYQIKDKTLVKKMKIIKVSGVAPPNDIPGKYSFISEGEVTLPEWVHSDKENRVRLLFASLCAMHISSNLGDYYFKGLMLQCLMTALTLACKGDITYARDFVLLSQEHMHDLSIHAPYLFDSDGLWRSPLSDAYESVQNVFRALLYSVGGKEHSWHWHEWSDRMHVAYYSAAAASIAGKHIHDGKIMLRYADIACALSGVNEAREELDIVAQYNEK